MPKKLDLSQRSLAEHGMVKWRDTLDSDLSPRGKVGASSTSEENSSKPMVISPPIQKVTRLTLQDHMHLHPRSLRAYK